MKKKKNLTVLQSYGIAVLTLFVFSTLRVSAQKSSVEFSIHTGGGFETFVFRPHISSSSLGYGGDIGIGFTGFFSPNWGIYFGAGFHMNNIQSGIDSIKYTSPLILMQDDAGNNMYYKLHSTLFEYTEIQQTMGVIVPVMLQFQTKQDNRFHWKKSRKVNFYLMFGAKLHFLFNSKYNTAVSKLNNWAEFPDFGNEIAIQEHIGLGEFDVSNSSSSTGKLDFGFMTSVAIETGVKWRVDRRVYLYTGFYFDCGINDPFKDKRVDHSNFTREDQLQDLTLMKFADGMHLLAVGIKLRVGFWRGL